LKVAWTNFKKNTTQEMKKLIFLFRFSFLYTILLFAGCGSVPGSTDPQQYIIDVTGTPMVLNCSKSYSFASHYTNEENDLVSLAVSAGDLLYFQLMEDEILTYRYNPTDGLNLSVRYDSIYGRFYLNDELTSIHLSEGSAAWDWLEGADEEVLTGIRSFHISLPLSETEINSLENISREISNPGLYIEGDSLLAEVLSVIQPGWLVAEDMDYNKISDATKASLKKLELLLYAGEDPIDHDFLFGLKKLNSLIIQYWDSTDLSDFQFSKLKSLESLSIIESNISDLASIAASSKIRNLNLIYCETLKEIGPAVNLSSLTCLGLTGCQNIIDIQAILRMPQLTRLSVAGNTSQTEFAEILTRHSKLQVLELIDCDSITDLSPLEGYLGLKALTLDMDIPDLTPVSRSGDLELLVLPEDFFEDSLAVAEIQQAMPQTKIIAGGGFCLGSGWILLLVPAIIIGVVVRKRITGSFIARSM
jgi:hypothetical protein